MQRSRLCGGARGALPDLAEDCRRIGSDGPHNFGIEGTWLRQALTEFSRHSTSI